MNGEAPLLLRLGILRIFDTLHILLPMRTIYNWCRYAFNLKVLLRNANFIKSGAPDGLPIPPPFLIHEVSGVYDQRAFYDNGVDGAECIRDILHRNDLAIEGFESILDFGCGCGRVLRHWQNLTSTKIYGTDYNPRLVAWCSEHLPLVTCSVNSLSAHLDYPGGTFDFIYAISVFTHLTEDLQAPWRDELYRVLKPGGYALFTFQGSHHQHRLTEGERKAFAAGKLIVQQSRYPGMNTCQVFHPEAYVRALFSQGGDVVDFIPGGSTDAGRQDVVVVRRVTK